MKVSKEDIETLKKAQDIIARMENKFTFKDDYTNIIFNVELKKIRYGLESMIDIISKYLYK